MRVKLKREQPRKYSVSFEVTRGHFPTLRFWQAQRQPVRARARVCVGGLLRHTSSSSRGLNQFTSSDRFLLSTTQSHCNSTLGRDRNATEGLSRVGYSTAACWFPAGILNKVDTVPVRAAVGALFINVAVRCHPRPPCLPAVLYTCDVSTKLPVNI